MNFYDLDRAMKDEIKKSAVSEYIASSPDWLRRWEARHQAAQTLDPGKILNQGRDLLEAVIISRMSSVWNNLTSRVNSSARSPIKTERASMEGDTGMGDNECRSPTCEMCSVKMVWQCPDGCEDIVRSSIALPN